MCYLNVVKLFVGIMNDITITEPVNTYSLFMILTLQLCVEITLYLHF